MPYRYGYTQSPQQQMPQQMQAQQPGMGQQLFGAAMPAVGGLARRGGGYLGTQLRGLFGLGGGGTSAAPGGALEGMMSGAGATGTGGAEIVGSAVTSTGAPGYLLSNGSVIPASEAAGTAAAPTSGVLGGVGAGTALGAGALGALGARGLAQTGGEIAGQGLTRETASRGFAAANPLTGGAFNVARGANQLVGAPVGEGSVQTMADLQSAQAMMRPQEAGLTGSMETPGGVGGIGGLSEQAGGLQSMLGGLGGGALTAALPIAGAGLGLMALGEKFGIGGSGKGKDQRRRDAIRSGLQDVGLVDENYNVVVDGKKFNIGKEGGEEKQRAYNVDFEREGAGNAVADVQPLSAILTGESGKAAKDTTGFLANTILETGEDPRKLYDKAGIDQATAFEKIGQLRDSGEIDDATARVYQNSVNQVFGQEYVGEPEETGPYSDALRGLEATGRYSPEQIDLIRSLL